MRTIRWIGCLTLMATLVVGLSGLPARADMPGLPWRSPAKITSGVPVRVASIRSCPAVPIPGDSVLVQINLSFGPGGGTGQVVAARPDGSWSGTVAFFFSGVNVRHTTISAECLDFNGITGVPYAQYMVRRTQVFD